MKVKTGKVQGGSFDGAIVSSYNGSIEIIDDLPDGSFEINFYEHTLIDGEWLYVRSTP